MKARNVQSVSHAPLKLGLTGCILVRVAQESKNIGIKLSISVVPVFIQVTFCVASPFFFLSVTSNEVHSTDPLMIFA